ncbi:MAG: HAMP domain-containing histidine kinase [Clostridia bacterium]|nr:HAMP domain-containing histidine kinase [Clostridia bacterium]
MTKKKIIKMVILGFVLFLIASVSANFFICAELVAKDFHGDYNPIYHEFSDFSWEYELDESHKKIAENSGMSDINVFMQKYLESGWKIHSIDYPFRLMAVDEQGNWYEAYYNYVQVYLENEEIYFNLDDYLNENQKKELYKMSKQSEVIVEDIKLGHNGKNYVLNEITFTNHDELKAAYTFSTQESVTEGKAITTSVLLKEIEVKPYDKMYLSKLYDDIEKDYGYNQNFGSSGGGGYISSEEAHGHHGVEIDGKNYIIYYAMSYNLPMRVITSDEFKIYTYMFFIFLSIAGVVFLIFCLKLNKKSEIIENSKRIFISAAAHELKTPLAVIQNQCECIIENVLPEKNGEYMASIYDETLRMNGIVTSLLTFNRISTIDKITKEKCNLTHLLYTETNKYLSFAQSKGAEITLDAEEDVFAMCNAELMALAIDNYLSNAVKYATDEKKIKVSLYRTKDEFNLEVFNTGTPIDEKKATEIWGIFERKDVSRTRDGNSTGMGLPICKRIFDLHGFRGEYKAKADGIEFSVRGKL